MATPLLATVAAGATSPQGVRCPLRASSAGTVQWAFTQNASYSETHHDIAVGDRGQPTATTASISTSAPRGRAATPIATRAGGSAGKNPA